MRKLVGGAVALGVAALPLFCPGETYKWTDAQGHTQYTDTPRPGATRVETAPLQIYAPPRRTERLKPNKKPKQTPFNGYSDLVIGSPEQDEALWDNAGSVTVQARLQPALQASLGHKLQFSLDGQPTGNPTDSQTTTLTDIERGEHQLQVFVVDSQGTRLKASPVVTIHMKKINVNNRPPSFRPRS